MSSGTMAIVDVDGVGRVVADWWVAEDGKAIRLEHYSCRGSARGPALGPVLVTVCPAIEADPYRSATLLDGRTKPIRRLLARRASDHGVAYLEIEAGSESLGPTYRLYPVRSRDEHWQATTLAPAEVGRSSGPDALLPVVRCGLYDDWDDDLGVPWAYPLQPLRRVPLEPTMSPPRAQRIP